MRLTHQKRRKKRYYLLGILAEYYAVFYMLLRGYVPLALRFKTKMGEVDLILRKRGVIAFVEVKYRQDIDVAAASVSTAAQQRIMNTAQIFMQKYEAKLKKSGRKGGNVVLRFDVIALSPYLKIRHIPNAFGEQLCRIF